MSPEIGIILIAQKNDPTIYLPLISGLIGLFGVFLGYWLKEQNENDQEEFNALSITKELLDLRPINQVKINDFYNTLRFNLRARRLRTYELMVLALLNAKENKSYSSEEARITARLNVLNKKRLISRIESRIRNFFSR